MIPWWWLIVAGWVGSMAGFFVAAMMAVGKDVINEQRNVIEEQRKMRQEFEKEWDKWGKVR